MPIGDDKNLVRLAICIAVYHARFGVWPTHARRTRIEGLETGPFVYQTSR